MFYYSRVELLVCMETMCLICLDTDSKLFLMSKHNLVETYELLTGLSLCHRGNRKQTLSILCAQRLMKFRQFRDLSLRAHSLIMDLVEQHGFMNTQHIELLNKATEHLKFNLTQTMIGPDQCDLYIDKNDEEQQTAAKEAAVREFATVVVKKDIYDATVDNLELSLDDNHIQHTSNDSVSDDEYSDMSIQLKSGLNPASEDLHRKPTSYTTVADHVPETEIIKCESITFGCTICLEDFVQETAYNEHMSTHLQNASCDASQVSEPCAAVCWDLLEESLTENKVGAQVLNDDPCLSTNFRQGSFDPLSTRLAATNKNNVQGTEEAGVIQRTEIFKSEAKTYYSCDICYFKAEYRSRFLRHMTTHTGLKPFFCAFCSYKCSMKCHLLTHIRTHTGEKPYSCEICNYKCARNSDLLRHMGTHTGEKRYACEICNYKCAQNSDLFKHMRTHTGEKPFSCKLCDYKCARKGDLLKHMRTHTREKRYMCDMCNFKCGENSDLLKHKRTHTGEKPYLCAICDYKCARKGNLSRHIKAHGGEKLQCCEICNYKCVRNSNLVKHMRIHSVEA